MCKSKNEGGQRCAAHTRPKYEAAAIGTKEWDEAAKEYASTPEGAQRVAEDADRLKDAGDYENEARAHNALKQGEALRAANGETAKIVNLRQADPVDVDTELADLYYEEMRAEDRLDGAWQTLGYDVDRRGAWERQRQPMSRTEMEEKVNALLEDENTPPYKVTELQKKLATIDARRAEVEAARTKAAPLQEEFERRGGWTRAFLVDNTNGHVHKDMACSTTFPTTRYAWMTQYSGKDEATIVEDAGERCCTVCYPSAPVESLNRPTKMFSQSEITAAEARQKRAAEKAERDRKKLEKAILPDGGELRWKTYRGYTERTSTLISARKGLVDLLDYEGTSLYDNDTKEGIEMLTGAIAEKEGKTPGEVLAEAKERLRKRK